MSIKNKESQADKSILSFISEEMSNPIGREREGAYF